MIAVVALLALALTSPQADPQEKPRVPDDSIELTVTGCLKGRVLTTVGRRAGRGRARRLRRRTHLPGQRQQGRHGRGQEAQQAARRSGRAGAAVVPSTTRASSPAASPFPAGSTGCRQREHPDRRGQHPGHGRQRDAGRGQRPARRPVETAHTGRVDPVGSGLQTRPTRQLGAPRTDNTARCPIHTGTPKRAAV